MFSGVREQSKLDIREQQNQTLKPNGGANVNLARNLIALELVIILSHKTGPHMTEVPTYDTESRSKVPNVSFTSDTRRNW